MRYIPQSFYDNIASGMQPIVYIVIETQIGLRLYSNKQLDDHYEATTLLLDGSWLLDGSMTLGVDSIFYASKDPIIVSYDKLQETLSLKSKDLLTGYTLKKQSSFTVGLNNADRKLGALLAAEPFITRPLRVYIGDDETPSSEHIKLFEGVVDEVNIDVSKLTITAIED